MQSFSTTQAANIGAFAGLVVIVLSQFGVEASKEEVTFIIGALIILGTTAVNYWNRWKKGDITLAGLRK